MLDLVLHKPPGWTCLEGAEREAEARRPWMPFELIHRDRALPG